MRKALSGGGDLSEEVHPRVGIVDLRLRHAHDREAPLARIDYVELVDAETLQPIDSLGNKSLLALAVFFGKTRLDR